MSNNNLNSNNINDINKRIKKLLDSYNGLYSPNISSNNKDLKEYIKGPGNNIDTKNSQKDTDSNRGRNKDFVGFSEALTRFYKNTDLRSKIKERRIMFWGISIYFILMTIMVGIFICLPQYSDALKKSLIYGFFANLIGLMFVICKFDFSSLKYNKSTSSNGLKRSFYKLFEDYKNK